MRKPKTGFDHTYKTELNVYNWRGKYVTIPMIHSLPQGSTPRPVLFILFMNDLPKFMLTDLPICMQMTQPYVKLVIVN